MVGQRWNRTTDTVIFSHVLYQLSYLAIGRGVWDRRGPGTSSRKDRARRQIRAL